MKNLIKSLFLPLLLISTYSGAQVYQWANSFGANGNDFMTNLKTDNYGNVYVAGNITGSVDMDPGSGIYIIYGSSFVAKYDNSGNLVFAYGLSNVTLKDIELDKEGNIYVAGEITGTSADVDLDSGTYYLYRPGAGNEPFFVKYTSSGSLIHAVHFGGNQNEYITGIAVDTTDQIYITGNYFGTIDIDPDSNNSLTFTCPAGASNLYLASFDSTFHILWAHDFGVSNTSESVLDLITDENRNCYIYGGTASFVDFDPGPGIAQSNYAGYVASYDASGNFRFYWGEQGIRSVYVTPNTDIYLVSSFVGTFDFDPTAGTSNFTSSAPNLVFARYTSVGTPIFIKQLGNTISYPLAYSITADNSGNCYLTGYSTGTMDFDPSAAVHNVTVAGQSDVYAAMYSNLGDFNYVISLSGGGTDMGKTIVCDNSGEITIGGYFFNTVDFNPDSTVANLYSNGGQDFFIARYNNQNPLAVPGASASSDNLELYPNPLSSNAVLKSSNLNGNCKIACYDITGREVRIKSEKICWNTFELDLNGLNPGSYFLVVLDDEKSSTIRFIKSAE